VTAAHDYEELYHLVDRLSPGQARRLLALAKADPELADVADAEEDAHPSVLPETTLLGLEQHMAHPGRADDALQRFQSFVGIIDSGRGDLSERHEEIIRDGFNSLA
jgi:hypothetical protein